MRWWGAADPLGGRGRGFTRRANLGLTPRVLGA